MKRWGIPFAIILAALAVSTAVSDLSGGILMLAVLPFRYIGQGLRALSLSGATGNIAAIALLAVISLLPLLPILFRIRKKQKAPLEHLLCVLAAMALPFLLYWFVNPQLITGMFHPALAMSDALKAQGELMLSLCFWSLAAAYAVLRALRVYDGSGAGKGMTAALVMLTGAMLISVFYVDVYELTTSIRTAVSQGTVAVADPFFGGIMRPKTNPGVDILLAVLRFAGSAVPSLLLLSAFPVCFRLLGEIAKDRFAAGNADLALVAAQRARRAIIVSVLLGVLVNFIQLLLVKFATDVGIHLDLPLLELLTAFLLLLLAEGFRKGFELADENRQFV